MWYHDGIQEKVIIMNIDMKYLTVDAPKNAMMLWAIMAFGILAVVFTILAARALIKQHDAMLFMIPSLFLILGTVIMIVMYQNSASVDINALNESSGVTITEVKEDDEYSNAGKSIEKFIKDKNSYDTTRVYYIKDGKIHNDGVIIIHQGKAGLFGNGSQSLKPILANK